jgi:hypothetical protein
MIINRYQVYAIKGGINFTYRPGLPDCKVFFLNIE